MFRSQTSTRAIANAPESRPRGADLSLPSIQSFLGVLFLAAIVQGIAEFVHVSMPEHQILRDVLECVATSIVGAYFLYFVYRGNLSLGVLGITAFSCGLLITAQVLDITDEIASLEYTPILGQEGAFHRTIEDSCTTFGIILLISSVLLALYEISAEYLRLKYDHRRLAMEVGRRKETERALQESEARFRGLFDNFVVPIATFDRDLRVDHLNAAAANYLGGNVGNFLGKTLDEILELEESDFIARLREVVETGIGFADEDEAIIDGKSYWFSFAVEPIRDSGGAVTGVQLMATDITSKNAAETALRRSEESLANAQRIAHVGSFDWNVGTGQVWCSEECQRIFGFTPVQGNRFYSADEMLARVHADDLEEYKDDVRRSLRQKRSIRNSYRIQQSSDSIRHVYFESALTQDAADNIVMFHGAVRDITERVESEKERQRLESHIQRAQKMESLGVLAGGIAHDFNNILVGVLGNVGFALEEADENGELRECLTEIETSALRAADLAQLILAYSGQGRFIIEPADLTELTKSMRQQIETVAETKATTHYELTDALPPVEVDAAQMRQAVLSLVTNAVESLEGPRGRIVLRTGKQTCDEHYLRQAFLADECAEGEYVFLEVEDSGSGMDEVTLERLFEPFYTTKFTGRGLGLSAVLGIVRGHHGAVRVTSIRGVGTTVRLLFPVSTAPVVVTTGAPATGTVMVIDDEDLVLKTAGRMLRRLGFTPVTMRSGAAAVEHFEDHAAEIDCVVLDLTMPYMTGDETLAALRAIRPDIPAIICSGFSSQEIRRRFEGVEISGFLQKPFSYPALQRTLTNALARSTPGHTRELI